MYVSVWDMSVGKEWPKSGLRITLTPVPVEKKVMGRFYIYSCLDNICTRDIILFHQRENIDFCISEKRKQMTLVFCLYLYDLEFCVCNRC